MPDVWGGLLGRSLRFVQWRRTQNLVKERNPICAWTNGIAQQQFAGDQMFWGKLIPIGLALTMGMKTRSLDALSQYSVFHL